jgi:hypothetical protein
VLDLVRNKAVPDVCAVYAASGPVLVSLSCATNKAVVRDLATGVQAPAPALGPEVAVAGTQLAVRRADGIVHVYDWASGAERYSASVSASLMALASDGTVVASTGTGCGGHGLVRITVDDPVARPLPVSSCANWLAISGTQLIYRDVEGDAMHYRVAALDGSAQRDIAVITPQKSERGSGHVNGDGLAFASESCGGTIAVSRVSLAAPTSGPAGDVHCPGTVSRARLSARAVRVRVTCAAGCSARLQLRAAGHGVFATRTLKISSGERVVAIRIGKLTHKRLARARRVQVQLRTTNLDDTTTTVTRTLSVG